MTLAELITALEAANPQQVVQHGFTNPHSYRGDYMDLAFEPAANVTVADMLADARSALGTTYQGWKGGDFEMRDYTWCWLSQEGDASGETISALLLSLMLAAPAAVLAEPDRAAVLLEAADRIETLMAEAYERALSEDEIGYANGLENAMRELRRLAAEAPQQPATVCVCGEPGTPGTVHRTDGPCHIDEQQPATGLTVTGLARLLAGGSAIAGRGLPYDLLSADERKEHLEQARQLLDRTTDEATADEAQQPDTEALPSISANDVQGFCPACGHPTLYIGEGGHLTCALMGCPKPESADELLHNGAAEAPEAARPSVLREIAITLDQLAATDVIRKRRSLATARRLLAVELRRMADAEPAPVAQQPAAEDTCRPVDVDGETVLVRGSSQMTEQERGYFAEVARAAKRKHEAEQQPAAADTDEAGAQS